MSNMFHQILQMSITASYVIIAVLLLRYILRNAPKKYSYMLWAAVLFRLCCPVSFRSVLSIFNLALRKNDRVIIDLSEVPVSAEPVSGTTQPISTGIPQFTETIQETFLLPVSAAETTQPTDVYIPQAVSPSAPVRPDIQNINMMDILCIIWIAGILFLVIRAAISYLRLRKDLQTSVPYIENIRRADIRSPFLMGLIRPMIYIPFDLDPECETISIAHERYHQKRKDHWVRMISYLLLCIHWFNPLCWLAYILMEKDMEMSCDEQVLSDGQWSRKDYSRALLSVSSGFRFPSANPVAFGESNVKERILNSMKFKNPNKVLSIVAAILCIITLVSCASNGKQEPSAPDDPGMDPSQETVDYGPYLEPVSYKVQPAGGNMRSALIGDDGFYGTPTSKGVYFFSRRDPASNTDRIMFLDYSTGKTSCVCDISGCEHSDGSCPAYVEDAGDFILLTTEKEDCLYLFSTTYGSLTRMDFDGRNRKLVLSISDHQLAYCDRNSIQTYGNKIYMVMMIPGSASDEHPRGFYDLIELDPEMMTYRVVMSLGESTGIAGGFDDKILLSEMTTAYDVVSPPFDPRSVLVYRTFDVTTGEVEVVNKIQLTSQSYYEDGNLMILELQSDGSLVSIVYGLSDPEDGSFNTFAELPEFLGQEPNMKGSSDGPHKGKAIDSTHFYFYYGEYETDENGDLKTYPPLDRPQFVKTHCVIVDAESATAVPFDDYAGSFVFARNEDTFYIVEYNEYYVPVMTSVSAHDYLNGIRK